MAKLSHWTGRVNRTKRFQDDNTVCENHTIWPLCGKLRILHTVVPKVTTIIMMQTSIGKKANRNIKSGYWKIILKVEKEEQ